jgi:hypothetical protein
VQGDAPKFPASGYFGPGDIAKPMSIPEQRLINGTEFPLVLGPSPTQCKNGCTLEEIYDWVKHSKNVIDNLLLRVRASATIVHACLSPSTAAQCVYQACRA